MAYYSQAVESFKSPSDKQVYLEEIKQPMDLSTMQQKLPTYASITDFEVDLRLMLDNCMQFNGIGDAYYEVSARSDDAYGVLKLTR